MEAHDKLTPLERDFIGDLAQDAHRLSEIFVFARLHHPDAPPVELRRIASQLVSTWITRGWLQVVAEGESEPHVSVGDVPQVLQDLPFDGPESKDQLVWLWLTEKARRDVDWLR